MNLDAMLTSVSSPTQDDDRVFSEPWQAKAFAIVVQLAEQNIIQWKDWVDSFSAEVAKAELGDYQPDVDYYPCWVRALENLLTQNKLTKRADIEKAVDHTLEHWPHPDHVAHREPILVCPATA